MLIFRFRVEDLANVRFAVSPLTETMRSVNVLDDGGGHALHLPWIAQARERTRDLPLERLRALQPAKVLQPRLRHPAAGAAAGAVRRRADGDARDTAQPDPQGDRAGLPRPPGPR